MVEIVKQLLGKDLPKEMEILSNIKFNIYFLSLVLRMLVNAPV